MEGRVFLYLSVLEKISHFTFKAGGNTGHFCSFTEKLSSLTWDGMNFKFHYWRSGKRKKNSNYTFELIIFKIHIVIRIRLPYAVISAHIITLLMNSTHKLRHIFSISWRITSAVGVCVIIKGSNRTQLIQNSIYSFV